MKVDILAFGAHPDDIELGAGGTLAHHIKKGYKAAIVDLTQGDLGTRGTIELRMAEADAAGKILGLSARENLKFRDGFFVNDEAHQMEVIRMIRKYQPKIVIANAIRDRHPDHGKGSDLVSTSCFLAGLRRIETVDEQGNAQDPWRPEAVYHYIQFYDLPPDLVVDVSDSIDQKMQSIEAYASQFYDPNSTEPATVISSKQFLDVQKSRCAQWGQRVGVAYGEAFTVERYVGVDDLTTLL
ncbi:MAG: bacillithiol biosynthesis deacetylase BshB1 [Schleiferiaceae bacterium]